MQASFSPPVGASGPAPGSHLAFVEVMGSIEESAPAWRPTVAGFLVLRLVDRWANASSGSDGGPPPHELLPIRRAVVEAPHGPIREALVQLVGAIAESWGMWSSRVSSSLLAYAHLLQQDEAYNLAADAYETFLSHAHASSDLELAADAYLRLGFCLRRVGRIEAANIAYEAARMFAAITEDTRAVFLSRVGAASIARHRGNLPAAQAALEAVIVDATALASKGSSPVLDDVLGRAKHDLATVLKDRGNPERAVPLYYEVLEMYEDAAKREVLLNDIADTLAALGLREAARDAHLVNYVTARQPTVRWTAAINLMELAALDEQETAFQQYRRDLASAPLPPLLDAHYQLQAGQGCYRFGRVESARASLSRAVEIASKHQINDILIRAESALDRLERAEEVQPANDSPEPSPEVAHVVRAVRRMRELASAGAT